VTVVHARSTHGRQEPDTGVVRVETLLAPQIESDVASVSDISRDPAVGSSSYLRGQASSAAARRLP